MAQIYDYKALNFIRNELHRLRCKWCAFRRLSVIGENDDGVVGESAGAFFEVVQRALWLDAGLSMCRLFDNRRGTETLGSALRSVKNQMPDADFTRLKESLDQIEPKVKAANLGDARGLVIAHSNREVARGSAKAPSSGIQAVEDIVQSTSDWVTELHGAVGFECKFDESELHSSMDGLVKRLRGTLHSCSASSAAEPGEGQMGNVGIEE